MATKDKNYLKNFMERLHEATAGTQKELTPEQLNKKIMNTVRVWWKKGNKGYQRFTDRGKSDPEFFANNFAKAGVGMKEGWEFTKKTLTGYLDAESLEDGELLHDEYKKEYQRTPFDQEFRDGFMKH